MSDYHCLNCGEKLKELSSHEWTDKYKCPNCGTDCQKQIEIGDYALAESGFMDGKPVRCYTCLPCIDEWLMVQEKPKTIDPEEIEVILEDLDFMVETVRQNCGIVSFLSVAHSATILRRLLRGSGGE